jgi:hypothetical protein
MRRWWLFPFAAFFSGAACGLETIGTGPSAVGPGTSSSSSSSSSSSGGEGGPGPSDGGPGDEPVAPYKTRVTSGLVALGEVEEGGGDTLHDAVEPRLDLALSDVTDVSWSAHAIQLKSFTSIASVENFEKSRVRSAATHEVTIEAWIVPGLAAESDYARMISFSRNDTERNFAVGAYQDKQFWASMADGEDLHPSLQAKAQLTHLVAMRTSDGKLHLVVDKNEIGVLPGTTDPSAWLVHPLTIGNIPGGGKGWLGTIHLLAVYDRALSPLEIAQNFAAGADP